MKTFKILLFYFLFIIYSLEILLFFFVTENNLSKEQIFNKRIEIAEKKGIKYDPGSREEAFLDFRKDNEDLEPTFYYSPAFRFSQTFKNAKKNNKIIPFRGPINSKSLTCAEDLKYKLIINDKFGFKNSNSIYENKINSMLLGDSFAEGSCVLSENDIAGNLTKEGFSTVNFGVSGSSPLVSLGIVREFGGIIKPKNFIYLYYEGNDLEGLNWEKEDSHLIKYINNEYNIDYLTKYDEINNFLELYSAESIAYIKQLKNKENSNKKSNFKIFKENLIDILELKKIKYIIRHSLLQKKHTKYDLDLFFLIIKKMNLEAKKHSANYIFVYVPHFSRYISFPQSASLKETMDLKKNIINEIEKMNISTIDLTNFFDKSENVKQYYPLGYIGHFNGSGYKKISEIIVNKLN